MAELRTVREVVAFLSTIDPDEIIAINQMWLKEDAEDYADESFTDEEWHKIAYYWENNERLGEDGVETLMDGVQEVLNG